MNFVNESDSVHAEVIPDSPISISSGSIDAWPSHSRVSEIGSMQQGKKGALSIHANCSSHKQLLVAWNQYQLNHRLGSTIFRLNGDQPD